MSAEVIVSRLARSLLKFTGRTLLPGVPPGALAPAAFNAPFVLLAHGVEPAPSGPLLCYGNAAALALFELEPTTLVGMPSRLTAEPEQREERASMLRAAGSAGFIDNYAGIRVAASGRRFRITGATVWTMEDEDSVPCGQGAMFATWEPLLDAPAAPVQPLVHVRVQVKPGTAELFRALTLANVRASRHEPGNIRFDLLCHTDDPHAFTLVEQYVDTAAAAAHKATPHYLRWRDAVAGLMAVPRAATPHVLCV
jgi:quinol monooxygenase YgiN